MRDPHPRETVRPAPPANAEDSMANAAAAAQGTAPTDQIVGDATPAHVALLRRSVVISVLLLFFVAIPAMNLAGIVPDYKVNVLGKYLCFAIVALGIDLIWGYTGLLSLCQALFFCAGGYAMAMHLSLPQGGGDVRPEYHNIPQFMFFNSVHELPAFWRPFASLPFTLAAGIFVPALIATVFGFFILRSRVRGVYFSIVTQAVAWGAWLLISRNEMLLGGTNGLTNFNKAMTQSRPWILGLYLTTLTMIVLAYLLCRYITGSRAGRLLVAVRDKETRLYFSGYKPYAFKVFAFAIAAVLGAIGGMLYSPQVTVISPQNMNVEASIDLVVLVAVGGRGRLWGAILGAIIVSFVKASLTSDLPTIWPFVAGGMYVSVVLLFPDGFVRLWDRIETEVAGGTGWLKAAMTGLPLLAIAVFILAEALDLVPAALRKAVRVPGVGAVQWKYLLLVAVLLGAWAYHLAGSWQRWRRGAVAAATPAIA